MTHLFIASAMGAMAYLMVVPVLICSALAGLLLAIDGAKTWANIHGGVLLTYAAFEVRTRDADSSLEGISTTTDLMAVAAVAFACFFAWRSTRPAPAQAGEKAGKSDRSTHGADFLFAFSIQIVSAAVAWLLLWLAMAWHSGGFAAASCRLKASRMVQDGGRRGRVVMYVGG